jgi:NADH:ubiquinone oxidoreductase subunit 2 (subunit N)
VLNSIVALYYYLVVIKVIYVDRSADEEKPIEMPAPYSFVMAVSTVAVILLGTFLVSPIVNWATEAGKDLFRL